MPAYVRELCAIVTVLVTCGGVQIGSPSAPVLEFLEEWTTEPLEEIACSIIPSSTKVSGACRSCTALWGFLRGSPLQQERP
jgi:hypothetical protein